MSESFAPSGPDPFTRLVVSWEEWEQRTEPFHLKISDVLNLTIGQSIKLLLLDRNVWDVANTDESCSELPQDPAYYFRHNTAEFIKQEHLKGKMVFNWDGNCTLKERTFEDWEFEIEFKPNNWYPLKDGKLPEQDQGFFHFDWRRHWSEFDRGTHIGFRGPAILWSVVQSEKVPLILNRSNSISSSSSLSSKKALKEKKKKNSSITKLSSSENKKQIKRKKNNKNKNKKNPNSSNTTSVPSSSFFSSSSHRTRTKRTLAQTQVETKKKKKI